ncbi:MAG TPA: proprotein convertase P-domain-containing protein, partial [Flavobacteriales bacterium]|nr:proprotein convertase P-domain-containing protein [Flavobacteriales bacterium]
GSAGSITIEVDNDAGGPNGYVAMLTVAAPGNYGPYGPYATGSPVNVRLVHNVNALCNLNFNGVVGNCDGPGGLCAYSSSGATNILDNQTVTNTITVPPNGGQTLTDLNVYVNITHTYTSDLRLTLQSPSGTSVALINTGVCGSNDNMTVEFDQQAASTIGTVCPMTGIFAIPSASLASFNGQAIQGTWTLSVQDVAGGDEGTINSWCLIPALSAPAVQVSPKVFLEGPYSTANGLMSDAMRSAALVPNAQPYTGLGYGFTGSPGAGGTLGGGVLAVTGSNAIVDWVIVELRSTATPTTVVASCAALVQRDGDVVALDGTSPVSIAVASGAYHVAIRHRNHLGVMTQNGVALSNTPSTVDFTSVATSTYGTNARKSMAGAFPA